MPGLRYVILRHEGIPDPHFDLMFEQERGGLLTFRSPYWPIAGETVVERLADHRIAYLDYEGPVSEGRGFVARVEEGFYAREDVDPGRFVFRLSGAGNSIRLSLIYQTGEARRYRALTES